MRPKSSFIILTILCELYHAGTLVSGEAVTMNATQTTYVEVNTSLVLNCTYEGNLNPKACYFWRNDSSYTIVGLQGCVITNSSSFTVTCDGIKTVVFTLLRTGMEEHGVKWNCGFRADDMTKSNSTEIKVNVSVSSVKLSSPTVSKITLAENSTQDFRCQTSASRPIPTLSWFIDNNTPQTNDDVPISQIVSQSPAAGSEDFVVTTGSLTYKASKLANGKYIFCQSKYVDGNTMVSARKFLNVTYKPERGPLIISYNNSIIYYAIANKPQVLTCTITGGNPLASISWSCFTGNEENLSSGQMVAKRWTWRASSNGTCSCTSTHLGDDENVMLNVGILSPPTYLKFTLHSQTVEGKTTVKIIRDSTEPIICTAESVPAPDKYTWKYDGQSSPLSHVASLFPSQIASNGRYTCEVWNTMRPTQGQIEYGNITSYVDIQLLFAITKPVLTFGSKDGPSLPNSFQVIQGDDFNMYCSSSGNPVPNYLWTGDGRDIREQIISVQSITQDRTFTCTASNTMDPTSFQSVTTVSSSNMSVFVLFPPSEPTKQYHYSHTGSASISTSLKIIKGKSFNVTCAASAKPPPVVSWTGPRTSNSGTLVFTSIEESDDGIYNCTAINMMNRTFGKHEVGTIASSLHINVLFAPLVKPFSIGSVVEGDTFSVECKTEPGNPAATTYSWKRKLQSENDWTSLPSSDVSGSLLSKQKISRHDAGIYNCTAWNMMKPTAEQQQIGSSSKTFILDILYNTSISRFIELNHSLSKEVTVSENSSIHLQCEVDSNPGSTIIISKDGETKVSMDERKQISLINSRVGCDTAGIYKCIGYNAYNIGENKPSKDLKLFVTCSPRISSVDDFKKNITSALNEAAILKINIMAYPVPKESDYTWWVWNRETWDMVKTGNNIHINTSGLESSVIFHSVQQTDYQRYRLNVSNDYGHFHQEVFLNPYGKPESPRNVGFMEESVSQSTAQLSWNPGFNGGLDQTFVVLYKKNVDSTWLHVSIEDEKTESMNVTLKGLASGTTYEFQMYSRNSLGNSSFSEVYTFNTREMTTNEPFPAALIGGGIGGSVAAIVLISVIVVLFLRRSTFTKGKAKDASDGSDRKPVYEEDDEDGMQDNPMYVSAGPRNVNFNTGACSSEGAVEYSTVNKAAKAVDSVNDNEYAVVSKSKPKQAQTKTGKKEKKHGFFKDKKGKKAIPEGDIYENSPASEMKVVTKKEETIYENPETSVPKKNVNKDGLIYADLSFNDPPKGQRKLVIHGLDSMTEYVEVDFTKKADPLPDSDDENIPAKN